MEKMEAIKWTDEATSDLFSFDWWKVIDNKAQDRVQILFDEKPSREMIMKLKARGWRWSPTNSAWQRFRNSDSVRIAKDIFGK